MFMMMGDVRGMTEKSCKYAEYGSFEHLLFLFSVYVRDYERVNCFGHPKLRGSLSRSRCM